MAALLIGTLIIVPLEHCLRRGRSALVTETHSSNSVYGLSGTRSSARIVLLLEDVASVTTWRTLAYTEEREYRLKAWTVSPEGSCPLASWEERLRAEE